MITAAPIVWMVPNDVIQPLTKILLAEFLDTSLAHTEQLFGHILGFLAVSAARCAHIGSSGLVFMNQIQSGDHSYTYIS